MTDTDTPSGPQRTRKPLSVTPETRVLVQLGSLIAAAGSLVVATIFVWQIKTNGERALDEIRALRTEYGELAKEHRELWWVYQHTALRGGAGATGP